ncbi:methionine aminopeptidase [Gregarina niphandrodes]|uniref:Methionine aminopeptidase 2 n=1 Tax=Gregarina niphandrodes TaxID=110365 RepID=A0A023AXH8_GRENI|nr:methionine aminopeptidase [Gregarina niphandrodes]EZG43347.1 methionine aminopeptidase [Gregarina niphandrodes]|eukprot:XP_011133396.1 methionine aminopeptidase [Gregarina niphandrodes]
MAPKKSGKAKGKAAAAGKSVSGSPSKAVDAELPPVTFDHMLPAVENSCFRRLGDCKEVQGSGQTAAFEYPVDRLFEKGSFPVAEVMEYGNHGAERMSGEEYRERDRLATVHYDDLRRAAEAHRQTRRFMHSVIRPGVTTLEIAQTLEAKSRQLISAQGLQAGWAFPTGVSLNNCAAHYTPNYSEDPVVLGQGDIMKVDFGVHVGGRLVDSAWTVAFDSKFDPLIQATQDATNTGLKHAGIDVQLGELGGVIEEVIRSYEMEEGGKTLAIKPIRNLSGHSIEPYRIHAGKSVPIVACDDRDRMEEGEVYAIETFASTGRGFVDEVGACSHYMLDYDYAHGHKKAQLRQASAKPLLNLIQKNFGTLAFCRRWLDDAGAPRHLLHLKGLEQAGIVNPYPPLSDTEGSYTSQMEHTFILRPTCKEIISRGDDY